MDYNIKPLGKHCTATGDVLAAGAVCYSVVTESDGVFDRADFSAEAWTGPPEEALGWWKTPVPAAEAKPKPLDPDGLLRFFEQVYDDASASRQELLYVVALLLLQKRRLQLDQSLLDDDDAGKLTLVGSHGEGPFVIDEAQLTDEETERLQAELNAEIAAWS